MYNLTKEHSDNSHTPYLAEVPLALVTSLAMIKSNIFYSSESELRKGTNITYCYNCGGCIACQNKALKELCPNNVCDFEYITWFLVFPVLIQRGALKSINVEDYFKKSFKVIEKEVLYLQHKYKEIQKTNIYNFVFTGEDEKYFEEISKLRAQIISLLGELNAIKFGPSKSFIGKVKMFGPNTNHKGYLGTAERMAPLIARKDELMSAIVQLLFSEVEPQFHTFLSLHNTSEAEDRFDNGLYIPQFRGRTNIKESLNVIKRRFIKLKAGINGAEKASIEGDRTVDFTNAHTFFDNMVCDLFRFIFTRESEVISRLEEIYQRDQIADELIEFFLQPRGKIESNPKIRKDQLETAFKTLGLQPGANAKQIKNAYHKKCKELHPDRGVGNTEKFQSVEKAHSLLTKHLTQLTQQPKSTIMEPFAELYHSVTFLKPGVTESH